MNIATQIITLLGAQGVDGKCSADCTHDKHYKDKHICRCAAVKIALESPGYLPGHSVPPPCPGGGPPLVTPSLCTLRTVYARDLCQVGDIIDADQRYIVKAGALD